VGSIATARPNTAHPDATGPHSVGRSGRSRLSRTAPPPAAAQLRITGYDYGDGAVVAAAGELDVASGPVLAEHLAKLASGLRTRVVLDLAHLDFCDCAGLTVLLRAHHRFALDGGWLHLSAPGPTVHKTLRLTKLTRVLICYPSVAAAFRDPPAALIP
jgi:anti-sigma B factor antagonist